MGKKKEEFFWTSYSDLMTSLFFIMLTLFVLVAITFTMTKLMPGSPLQSKNITGELLEKMEAQYGLDKPPVEQFFIYIKNMLHGDLGTSYKKVGTKIMKGQVVDKSHPKKKSRC